MEELAKGPREPDLYEREGLRLIERKRDLESWREREGVLKQIKTNLLQSPLFSLSESLCLFFVRFFNLTMVESAFFCFLRIERKGKKETSRGL